MTIDLLFTDARLIGTPEPVPGPGWLAVSGSTIAAFGAGTPDDAQRAGRTVVDLKGQTLMPGFVDVHVHGAVGQEAMDGDVAGLRSMAKFFASRGVTSFLPTTWTASRTSTLAALRTIAEAQSSTDGARVVGAHMEGPYLSASRRGAQDPTEIRGVDPDEAAAFFDTGAVRLITVAPEVEGAGDLIDQCIHRGVTVSVGHTDATYEQVAAAITRGARHMTHTYNAMSPLRHRAPGAVGAALALSGFGAEVIADEVHVHPAAVRALIRARGVDEVVLVTDAIRPTGTTTSDGRLQGRPVAVRDGAVRFDDGQLVGSVLTMDLALRNVLQITGRPLAELWPVVSRNPAAAAGIAHRTGRLAPGLDADLVVLDEQHRVVRTLVQGRTEYDAADPDPDLSPAAGNAR
jgi:N-acetylglucosamine-6-phosphate deacetylase